MHVVALDVPLQPLKEPAAAPTAALEMHGIVKTYGSVRANRSIDFKVEAGSIMGLLGENGSGKSTLMKVLFGMTKPDAGQLSFCGKPLVNHRPREAISAGIAMIHQHFTLVDAMTVAENVMLGRNNAGFLLEPDEVAKKIRAASLAYGLAIDPSALVAQLSFGLRQRVEILKAILQGVKLLILDEPTSNLSPPEVAGLLAVMRRLKAAGQSVVFISHKLGEVIDVCDEVVVLRDGAVAGRSSTQNATRESLARMMVGRDLSAPIQPSARPPGEVVLSVQGLSKRDADGTVKLDNVALTVRAGEILAIAGVDGNGQVDLLDTLSGILSADSGQIFLDGNDVTGMGVSQRLVAGLAYIPVDRSGTSLVPGMSIADNLAMRDLDQRPLSYGQVLNLAAIRERAKKLMISFDIRASNPDVTAYTLSGGNQQKIVLAREISRNPKVLLAFQPTWGLDPGAVRFVMEQLFELRDKGCAILYVSAELEEVFTLGDRIAVMSKGRVSTPEARNAVDLTRIGLMMAGAD